MMARKTWINNFLLLASVVLITEQLCLRSFESALGKPTNSSFSSPGYPSNISVGLRCVYRFVARPQQKVRITFTVFEFPDSLKPECESDYIELFVEIPESQLDLSKLPEERLLGRYCGAGVHQVPELVVSMYSTIVMFVHTDDKEVFPSYFAGTYEFFDAAEYSMALEPRGSGPCDYAINGKVTPFGTVMSPTYPGLYPDQLFCSYKFSYGSSQDSSTRGNKYRIRLSMSDFHLFKGGDHCPFDYVAVYDGPTNRSRLISKLCGQRQSFDLYSSGDSMLIQFVTSSGRTQPQDRQSWMEYDITGVRGRGFRASFRFDSDFVRLDFIPPDSHVSHIRGSLCDVRILSSGESQGEIRSPIHPSPLRPNITCNFYLDGLVDSQNLEQAKITFIDGQLSQAATDSCDGASISIFATKRGDSVEPTKQLCSDIKGVQLTSTSPRLLLRFQTSDNVLEPVWFRANYEFITNYAVTGRQAPSGGCNFLYSSSDSREGFFNSPRHPAKYPPNTKCTYLFKKQHNEELHIHFIDFDLEDKKNSERCTSDYIEIQHVFYDKCNVTIRRYCNKTKPGPIISDRYSSALIITFTSDGSHMLPGFLAKYQFIQKASFARSCGKKIEGSGGIISSPNYPRDYDRDLHCEWIIKSRNKRRIRLYFSDFELERSDANGCDGAVLRLYENEALACNDPRGHQPSEEACGRKLSHTSILSSTDTVRISFITSERSIKTRGFQMYWTEVLHKDECTTGFLCAESGFCIPKEMQCNGVKNCGFSDDSDEDPDLCKSETNMNTGLQIGLGLLAAVLIAAIIFLVVFYIHRRRRRNIRKSMPESTSQTMHSNTCDSLLKEHPHDFRERTSKL